MFFFQENKHKKQGELCVCVFFFFYTFLSLTHFLVSEEASLLGLGALGRTCERRPQLLIRLCRVSGKLPCLQLPGAGTPKLGGWVGRHRKDRAGGRAAQILQRETARCSLFLSGSERYQHLQAAASALAEEWEKSSAGQLTVLTAHSAHWHAFSLCYEYQNLLQSALAGVVDESEPSSSRVVLRVLAILDRRAGDGMPRRCPVPFQFSACAAHPGGLSSANVRVGTEERQEHGEPLFASRV